MKVYGSKFTPRITASETRFDIGETITYRLNSGVEVKVEITSLPVKHPEAPDDGMGYEGRFSDTGKIGFISNRGIVGWSGKTETQEQLTALLDA